LFFPKLFLSDVWERKEISHLSLGPGASAKLSVFATVGLSNVFSEEYLPNFSPEADASKARRLPESR